jgi:hypothetical protein
VGRMLLKECEQAAAAHGFRRLELMATLTGIALRTRGPLLERHDLEPPTASASPRPHDPRPRPESPDVPPKSRLCPVRNKSDSRCSRGCRSRDSHTVGRRSLRATFAPLEASWRRASTLSTQT